MLAENRGWAAVGGGRLGQLQRIGDGRHTVRVEGVAGDRGGHAAGLHLRVGENPVDGVDRAAGHLCRLKGGDPFVGRAGGKDRRQLGAEGVDVGKPCRVAEKTRILGQIGSSRDLEKGLELTVGPATQDQEPVGAGKNLVGRDVGVGIAHPARHHAADQVVHRLVHQPGDLGVEQGGVDMLALAGEVAVAQGGQDRAGGVHAGHHVGDGHAHLGRLAVGVAGDAHDPAHGLGQQVVARTRCVGAGLPETGDAGVDEAGEALLDLVIGEAMAGKVADLIVLDEDVGALQQLEQDRPALGLSEVQSDGALVAVGAEVIGALGGVVAVAVLQEGRAPAPDIVAGPRPLDLDHVGPEIAQGLGGDRGGQDARGVDDADAVKRHGAGGGGGGGIGHAGGLGDRRGNLGRSGRMRRQWARCGGFTR